MSSTRNMQRVTKASKRKLKPEEKETSGTLKSPRCNDDTSQQTAGNGPDNLKPSISDDTFSPYFNITSYVQPVAKAKTKATNSSRHQSGKIYKTKCPKKTCLVQNSNDCESVSNVFYHPRITRSFKGQVSLCQDSNDKHANSGTVDTNLKETSSLISVYNIENGPQSSAVYCNNNSNSHLSKKNPGSSSSSRQKTKKLLKVHFQESASVSNCRKAKASKQSPSGSVCTVSKCDSCDETLPPRLTRLKAGTKTDATDSCDEILSPKLARLKDGTTKTDLTVDQNTGSANFNKVPSGHTMTNQSLKSEVSIDVTSDPDSYLPDKFEKNGIKKNAKCKRTKDVNFASSKITNSDSDEMIVPPANETYSSTAPSLSSPSLISKADLNSSGFNYNDSVVREVQLKRHLWPEQHDKSKNVFHSISNAALGRSSLENRKAIVDTYITSRLSDLEVTTNNQPFCSRLTAICWHPRLDNLLCFASKHGDLNFSKLGGDRFTHLEDLKHFMGIGPGGCISAVKFDPLENEKFYTSSIDAKVCLGNLEKDQIYGRTVLLHNDSEGFDQWFSSLDVHQRDDMVVAGDTKGWVTSVSRSGKIIWKKRLHKVKINHIEFSPQEPYLLCSASLDRCVRMWDIRMMVDHKPMDCLLHDKGLNSAYFSLTNGTRLLTTDQFDEIRVYRAPFWDMETRIKHPHRFFQHITPIKANWHPISDNIICGRYPDEQNYPNLGKQKVIDVFDASTGKISLELKDVKSNGIVSLCQFNRTGDKLLTAMGYNIHIWSHVPADEEERPQKQKFLKGSVQRGSTNRNNGDNPENRTASSSHGKTFKVPGKMRGTGNGINRCKR